MKTYEKYKDSGIEWIGEIPTDWNVARLRYRGKSIIGITYKPDEVSDETNGTLVLRSSNVQNGKLDFKDCVYVDKKIQESQLTKEGDILVCARNGSAHLVGKCAYIPKEWENVSFGAFMSIVRTDLDKFLFYYFNSQVFKGQKGLFATSTINQLTSNMLNNLDIPIPPTKEEQTAIANYLDKKTAEIDQLIAEKKQLVALYQEEKTALINQAVTKGINPDVKLKDSGIEWLGDIPEHWEIKKIKHLLKKQKGAIKTGPFGSQLKNSDLSSSGDYKVYTQRNVLDNDFVKGIDRIDDEKFESLSGFEVFPKDILFTSRGTIGKCSIFPIDAEKGILHPCLIRIQIDEELVFHNWIVTYVNSSSFFIENVKLESNSTIIDVIYGGTLKEIIIPFPPKEEQAQIVQHIEKKSTRIDAKIARAEKYINLLTEYRTALISEVVTGKIKVID